MNVPKSPARRTVLLQAAAIGLAGPLVARADSYPSRPVRLVVGYTPGGTTDLIARMIAPRLSAELGQPVVVENRPGAGGNLATEQVARAAPDGYTLQMNTAGTMTVNPSIYRSIKFDAIRDFSPISQVASVPNVMVIHPSIPAKTVAEFVTWAKARPGQVFFASSGIGNTPHMTGELFNLRTGLNLVHVPYKGSAPALTELIGGQGVQVMFDNLPSAIGHVRSGSLRALATTGARRSAATPELPTLQEAGLKDFDVQGWFAVFAPAGLPPPIVKKLHAGVLAALADPQTAKGLADLGAEQIGNTPAELGRLVEIEAKRWADVVRTAAIPTQ